VSTQRQALAARRRLLVATAAVQRAQVGLELHALAMRAQTLRRAVAIVRQLWRAWRQSASSRSNAAP
jgi:hypothetical protein